MWNQASGYVNSRRGHEDNVASGARNLISTQVKQKGANADELYTWLETAQPLPRLGRPEEVAALVACVAKIPFCVGSMISVDGGYTAQ